MERDLFDIFPDLPWAGVAHPPARQWQQIPKPPRSAPLTGPQGPQQVGEGARRRVALRDALARIRAIAVNEQRRAGSKRKAKAALAEIREIADIALMADDRAPQ